MPKTGKMSTLVHAMKALLIRGTSILLTAYTNSAVDNLLIKLKAQVFMSAYYNVFMYYIISLNMTTCCCKNTHAFYLKIKDKAKKWSEKNVVLCQRMLCLVS
ncbi:DNA replication ATP-dependent helicase/nuclease DNA2 [Spatholobus suberectus]|nr:DNA replication ATP-dependent helicase/nuclease DNA2 [Spatholobus suberectus]